MDQDGGYYIYERGQLYNPFKKKRNHYGLKRTPKCMTENSKNALQPNLQNSYEKSIKSLFQICLSYVAKNILLVESFEGFPDIIGKQLFDQVVNEGKLAELSAESSRTLMLFSEGFGPLLLSSLDLSNQGMMINKWTQILEPFSYLSHLNLGHCRLEKGHDALQAISRMRRLSTLLLSDNSLCDSCIQKMTLPLRMYGTGPLGLQILNLAGNKKISSHSAKYLTCFKSLRILVLSGTSVKEDGVRKLKKNLGLLSAPSGGDRQHYPEVTTEGWAAEVVDGWKRMSQILDRTSARTVETASITGTKSNFYSKRSKPLMLAQQPDTTQQEIVLITSQMVNSSETQNHTLQPSTEPVGHPNMKSSGERMVAPSGDRSINQTNRSKNVCQGKDKKAKRKKATNHENNASGKNDLLAKKTSQAISYSEEQLNLMALYLPT